VGVSEESWIGKKTPTYLHVPFMFHITYRRLGEARSASLAGLGVFFFFFFMSSTVLPFPGHIFFTQALARWICVDSLLR
jgi:hypothetical protein